ncbi:DnaJ domain [Acidimicrobiia bacterium]
MELDVAVSILGVKPGMTLAEVRVVYRDKLRITHPDVRDGDTSADEAGRATALLNEAFTTIRLVVEERGFVPVSTPATIADDSSARTVPQSNAASQYGGSAVAASIESGDTLSIDAPPDEAFAFLLEASSRLGGIGYIDRSLGILEVIVRFEGGPSCSVLMTLQGRAFGTDVFCTMDSIEAAPTPPFAPVMEALLAELATLG